MFRDRTNLYISFRQTYSNPFEPPTLANGSESSALMTMDPDASALEMDTLPPAWVDVSDQVDELLADIRPQMAQLDTLHKQNALPGFDDRTDQEHKIDRLTYAITQRLHQCQAIMKRFSADADTPELARLAANMKISLATKIQDVSTTFRKMQSTYLRSLRSDVPDSSLFRAPSPGPGRYDVALEDEDDVLLSQSTLQQSSQLVSSQDAAIRQREQEITKIAQGILELSEIFRDLQTMVVDQGTLLDRIDYNIETMHTHVQHADKELVKASQYQRRTQKCKVILLLSLIVFGLLLAVILKPKHSGQTVVAPAPAAPQPTLEPAPQPDQL